MSFFKWLANAALNFYMTFRCSFTFYHTNTGDVLSILFGIAGTEKGFSCLITDCKWLAFSRYLSICGAFCFHNICFSTFIAQTWQVFCAVVFERINVNIFGGRIMSSGWHICIRWKCVRFHQNATGVDGRWNSFFWQCQSRRCKFSPSFFFFFFCCRIFWRCYDVAKQDGLNSSLRTERKC